MPKENQSNYYEGTSGKSNLLKPSFSRNAIVTAASTRRQPNLDQTVSVQPVKKQKSQTRSESNYSEAVDSESLSAIMSTKKPFRTNFKTTGRVSVGKRKGDFTTRTIAAKNIEMADRDERARRRDSLIRSGDESKVHREMVSNARIAELEKERSFIESRKEDRIAMLEYKASLKRKARESTAFRLDLWRQQRVVAERARQDELERQHDYMEWRKLDWREHEAYKKLLVQEDRSHLASLIDHWKLAKTSSRQDNDARLRAQAEEALRAEEEKYLALKAPETASVGSAVRASRRQSLAAHIAQETVQTQEALETHHSQLQALNAEFLGGLDEESAAAVVVDEEQEGSVESESELPVTVTEEQAESRGRVSLMLRLESWRQSVVEEEIRKMWEGEDEENGMQEVTAATAATAATGGCCEYYEDGMEEDGESTYNVLLAAAARRVSEY